MHREELLVRPMAHLAPAHVLEGLSPEDASRRISGVSHSIVEIVGQIVTLRQALGAWPPPAGSFTW